MLLKIFRYDESESLRKTRNTRKWIEDRGSKIALLAITQSSILDLPSSIPFRVFRVLYGVPKEMK